MTDIDIFNPDGVRIPAGTYSHVARVTGAEAVIVIAGQVGVSPDGKLAEGFEGQCEQVFGNLSAVLASAGAGWANVIGTMTFLTRREDLAFTGRGASASSLACSPTAAFRRARSSS